MSEQPATHDATQTTPKKPQFSGTARTALILTFFFMPAAAIAGPMALWEIQRSNGDLYGRVSAFGATIAGLFSCSLLAFMFFAGPLFGNCSAFHRPVRSALKTVDDHQRAYKHLTGRFAEKIEDLGVTDLPDTHTFTV